MGFDSGRVSFVRLLVKTKGPPPATVTPNLIDKLQEHAFTDSPAGAPAEIETGWVAGDHLFDQDFSLGKNAIGPAGNLLICALRIDTNRVPSELRRSYQRVHERAAAANNPSGFISRAQKKEARDAADQQVHGDLVAGKFRRSKLVPILWDLSHSQVYCSVAGNTVIERLCEAFRDTFDADLTPLSSGHLAEHLLHGTGKSRDFQDLRPSAFTQPPQEDRRDQAEDAAPSRDIPDVPWTVGSYHDKDFLGNELALWLWHLTERAEGMIPVKLHDRPREIALTIDRALEMECAWGIGGRQSLHGAGPTRTPEASAALRTGKWPRKLGLILSDGENQWELALQTDRWQVAGAMLPQLEEARSPRDLLQQRLEQVILLAQVLDALLQAFLDRRIGNSWANHRQTLQQWIKERKRG